MNDFKCASCNCQSECSKKRCYCKGNNTNSLSKCHGGKSCSNQPSEFEQDCEDDDLKQEHNDEEETQQLVFSWGVLTCIMIKRTNV